MIFKGIICLIENTVNVEKKKGKESRRENEQGCLVPQYKIQIMNFLSLRVAAPSPLRSNAMPWRGRVRLHVD